MFVHWFSLVSLASLGDTRWQPSNLSEMPQQCRRHKLLRASYIRHPTKQHNNASNEIDSRREESTGPVCQSSLWQRAPAVSPAADGQVARQPCCATGSSESGGGRFPNTICGGGRRGLQLELTQPAAPARGHSLCQNTA